VQRFCSEQGRCHRCSYITFISSSVTRWFSLAPMDPNHRPSIEGLVMANKLNYRRHDTGAGLYCCEMKVLDKRFLLAAQVNTCLPLAALPLAWHHSYADNASLFCIPDPCSREGTILLSLIRPIFLLTRLNSVFMLIFRPFSTSRQP
jgi:hypothetical protein